MKISIAMATYNGAKYLHEQLDSFLCQQRLPDELIVCDDASTDYTRDILEKFKCTAPFTVTICCNDKNLGHIRNFEKALSLCSGDVIFLSDQDDVWSEEKITKVLNCYETNPAVDVVINDAFYADENLNRADVTVLQKAISVGGGGGWHINGACTAITRRFLDFLLPFPENNCPFHDVYIHRWANAIGNKLVLDEPLQLWRIHGLNTTSNEMVQAEILSPLKQYRRTMNLEVASSYLQKAQEFRMMSAILQERIESLQHLHLARGFPRLKKKLEQVVKANENRARLQGLGWFQRKVLILVMIIKGQYSHFKGTKSIAKDMLR